MDAAARIATYLRVAGLESLSGREADVERAIRDLMEAMSEKVAIDNPESLYTYRVPMLTEDGTCSVVDQLAPVPYVGGSSEGAASRPRRPRCSSASSSARRRRRARTGSASTRSAPIPRAFPCW